MASDWTTLPLEDCMAAIIDYRGKSPEKTAFGIPLVTAKIVKGGRIEKPEEFIAEADFDDWMRRGMPKSGDIVMTTEAPLGEVAQLDGRKVALAQRVITLRGKPDVLDNTFLKFLLQSNKVQEELRSRGTGTTVVGIRQSELRKVSLTFPPLAEQKAIATVLGALDDKIELNRQMNASLETMTRALFQSWFISFDPVRAKLNGRSAGTLDLATATLFPDSFQDSPIGPVPKRWKVERFDVHFSAGRGLSYKGDGLRSDGGGLPMHNLNSVYEGGGYKHEGLKYYDGEYREKHLLEPGDMIVTNTEQGFDHLLIGHAAIVPRCYGPKGLFSHHIYRIKTKQSSPFSSHYLVELFNNRRWHYWISGFSNGTTINMLPMDALQMPLLVVPPDELVAKFTALAEAAHMQIEENQQQSRILGKLRDALLPKLLSGELRAVVAA